MDYPAYRQAGLPVTTAWMESLVKEINYRVKGTEMFWNDPEGAEAILSATMIASASTFMDGPDILLPVVPNPPQRPPKSPKAEMDPPERARAGAPSAGG